MDLNERKHHSNNGDWEWFKSFAGIGMPSNYYTFHIMSKIIDENPQIKRIIELGTYWGSMAVYLGLEGLRKGIYVHTFENKKQTTRETDALLNNLKVKQHLKDIFENIPLIIEITRQEPCYIIIDNGNKVREFKEIVPHLVSGSIVSVHDYGTEFYDRDWQIYQDRVEPYMQEEWLNHNVQLANFKVFPNEQQRSPY